MKLLLLGGPRFLGRAITDAALERGHELTFFNRGTTNPELYPEVERIVGDRKGARRAAGREWDAVVDTCGYLPRDVRASAAALAESGLYCFVSSISVYADFSTPGDEDSPVAELGDQPDDEVTNESYGALKALCESAVRDVSASARSSFARDSSSGRTTRRAASPTGRTASRAVARCSRPDRPNARRR